MDKYIPASTSSIDTSFSFTQEPKAHFNILSSFDINQIFPKMNISILSVKINPNISSEFVLINSNFSISYIQIQKEGIKCLGTYNEHTDRINDVCFCKRKEEPWNRIFFSGGNDGQIKLWKNDIKDSVKTISTNGKGPVIALDCNEMILCAGFGKEICIWEIDKLKQIGKACYAHSDLVSCVRLRGQYLITGGEDNIINVFDLKIGIEKRKQYPNVNNINLLDQDAVFITVNLGQSVVSLNVLEESYISAVTSVNTFHVIDLLTGLIKYEFDAKNEQLNLNYIIDAYYTDSLHQVELFCGSFSGNIALITFDLTKEQVIPTVEAFISTGVEQMFNSIGRYDKNAYIVCSDKGWIYFIQKQGVDQINSISNNKFKSFS